MPSGCPSSGPDGCAQVQGSCHESDFDPSCLTADEMRFACYRDCAIERSDASLCSRAQGMEGERLLAFICIDQYARAKQEPAMCERLLGPPSPDWPLYGSCLYAIQEERGRFLAAECLKLQPIKTHPWFFVDCIGQLARQEHDPSLCQQFMPMESDSTGAEAVASGVQGPSERCLQWTQPAASRPSPPPSP